jgi:hypothetical protein
LTATFRYFVGLHSRAIRRASAILSERRPLQRPNKVFDLRAAL